MVNLLLQAYDGYTPSCGISETTMIIAGLLFFLGYFISIVIVVGIAQVRRTDVVLLSVLCTPIAGLLYIIACNMNLKNTSYNNKNESEDVSKESLKKIQEDWKNALDITLGVNNKL